MEERETELNYFYQVFKDKYAKRVYRENKSNLGDNDDMEIYELLDIRLINRKYWKSIFIGAINDTCMEYLNESDSSINVIPNDTFDFIDSIIEENIDNPYKDSFIFSLDFIYSDYLELFNKGCPTFFHSTDSSKESMLLMTMDSRYKIIDFESINLSPKEGIKIRMNMFRMDYNNQLGPYHPKVHMKVRKDI